MNVINVPRQPELSTREKIIAAAYRVVGRQGMASSTIKEIATEAQLTPGLLHYHFKSKEDILVAVVQSMATEIEARWSDFKMLNRGGNFIDAAFATLERQITENPGIYRARFELYAHALGNPAVRPDLQKLLHGIIAGMTESFVLSGMPNTRRTTHIADILLACLDGFALRAVVDDTFDPKQALLTLKHLIKTQM